MKILVTGGAGFIGSHTVSFLSKMKHSVIALDNFKTGTTENLVGIKCSISVCDILDYKSLEKVFYDHFPHVVIHLAAQSAITTSWRYPDLDTKVNAIGTLNLLKLCNTYGVRKFIFSSTSAVYTDERSFFAATEKTTCAPKTPYGISKLSAEHFIRTMFKNHVIYRYGNVYGPRQRSIGENQVVARALDHFLRGKEFKVVGSGNQKRDFTFVEDVAFANAYAVDNDFTGTYNLCSGKSHSVNQILSIIEDHYGVRGYQWDHTYEEDPRGSVYINNSKIRKEIGIQFTGIKEGIRKTILSEDKS